jgi:N utilization substance protein A
MTQPIAEFGDDQLLELISPPESTVAVSGIVVSTSSDIAVLRLLDGRTATLPVTEFYPNRRFAIGARYHLACSDPATPRPLVSAIRPELIDLLAAGIVSELRDGSVRIVRVARQPGIRSKVAVAPTIEGVDAVGAFIGRAANRVSALSKLLLGERLDIIAFHPDTHTFLRNALGVQVTEIIEHDRTLEVRVPAHQYDAAVGGGGMNAMLTARLIGRRLSILPDTAPITTLGQLGQIAEINTSMESQNSTSITEDTSNI